MANSRQARKRARQAEKNRLRNASQRSMMRTFVKKVIKTVEAGDKSAATQALQAVTQILDRYATKGLIHKNTAARQKSQLNAKVKAMA